MIETVQCVNYRHQTFMSKLHADMHPMYITFVKKKKKRELLEKSLILPVLDCKCNQFNIINLVF